jgi:hypothetical protein
MQIILTSILTINTSNSTFSTFSTFRKGGAKHFDIFVVFFYKTMIFIKKIFFKFGSTFSKGGKGGKGGFS